MHKTIGNTWWYSFEITTSPFSADHFIEQIHGFPGQQYRNEQPAIEIGGEAFGAIGNPLKQLTDFPHTVSAEMMVHHIMMTPVTHKCRYGNQHYTGVFTNTFHFPDGQFIILYMLNHIEGTNKIERGGIKREFSNGSMNDVKAGSFACEFAAKWIVLHRSDLAKR